MTIVHANYKVKALNRVYKMSSMAGHLNKISLRNLQNKYF